MSTIVAGSRPIVAGLSGRRRLVKAIRRRLAVWLQVYRTRRHLLELTDRELRDLDLTREAARAEARRPFWHSNIKRLSRFDP